jgi:hypothetical protein
MPSPISSTDRGETLDPEPSAWERRSLALLAGGLALLLPLAWLLLRPGYSGYDEESQLDLQQLWLEQGRTTWHLGQGCLHRALLHWLLEAFGPAQCWLSLLRLPTLLAMLAAAGLLAAALRPRLGRRAALWAAMAWLAATGTWSLAGTLVCVGFFPAVFLLHWLALERLQKPWHGLLWGLSAALWWLDYEGWIGALAVLLPLGLALHWRRPGVLLAGAVGLAAGGLALFPASQVAAYVGSRGNVSANGAAQALDQFKHNVAALLGGGPRVLFSDAPRSPWPSAWTWPLILLGAGAALRRIPALGWLALVGGLPLLMPFTGSEPHRLLLLQLALAAAAGAGAARLCQWRWGQAALAALLLCGLAMGAWAWSHPGAALETTLGASWDEDQAARWMAANAPPEGWELIDRLGPWQDGDFRLRLASLHVPVHGGTPIALVHWDYLPGLAGMTGALRPFTHGGPMACYLFLPDPPAAARLRGIHRDLERLSPPMLDSLVLRQAQLRSALDGPALRDPWTRTALWEDWFVIALQFNRLGPGDLPALMKERLVSGWLWDALAEKQRPLDPAGAAALTLRADRLDPRRRNLPTRFARL